MIRVSTKVLKSLSDRSMLWQDIEGLGLARGTMHLVETALGKNEAQQFPFKDHGLSLVRRQSLLPASPVAGDKAGLRQ